MKEYTSKSAFSFLCDRMPSNFTCDRITYVCMLVEFQKTHGEKAIEALAGLYLYAIKYFLGNREHMIRSTFAHDLNGRNDKLMMPRSSGYEEFWNEKTYYA